MFSLLWPGFTTGEIVFEYSLCTENLWKVFSIFWLTMSLDNIFYNS